MSSDAVLLLVHALATTTMVGVIWTVQLVHYPLFALVGRDRFTSYEQAHMRRISLIVGPAMLIEAAASAWLVIAAPEGVPTALAWLGLALVAALWLSTALVQGPLHHRLSQGFDEESLKRLVATNWARTAAWSARGVVALVMLAGVDT